MRSPLQTPARYYMSDHRERAVEFCRALVARGLKRQAEWKPQTYVPANMFRTYTRPATATRALRYVVAYQDWTAGEAVSKPDRFGGPGKRRKRVRCVNGCDRKNEALTGECHNCRSRRLYATDPAYRAARIQRVKASAARRRQRMREDPEFRAAENAKRRAMEARKRSRLEEMLEAA